MRVFIDFPKKKYKFLDSIDRWI